MFVASIHPSIPRLYSIVQGAGVNTNYTLGRSPIHQDLELTNHCCVSPSVLSSNFREKQSLQGRVVGPGGWGLGMGRAVTSIFDT